MVMSGEVVVGMSDCELSFSSVDTVETGGQSCSLRDRPTLPPSPQLPFTTSPEAASFTAIYAKVVAGPSPGPG
jgi:hypothetical protein